MGEKTDEIKGRVKEAAGDLTDDPELKREGKIDELTADVKKTISEVAERVKDAVGKD